MVARSCLAVGGLLLFSFLLMHVSAAPRRHGSVAAAQDAPAVQATAIPSATLTWTDYPTGTTYDGVIIQRKPVTGSYSEIGRVSKGTTTYADRTITIGQVYCWVVVGYLGTATTPASNEVCGAMLPAPSGLVLRFQ